MGSKKKIDAKIFEEYFMLYINGQTNQEKFSEALGVTEPTLHDRLKTLMENGYLGSEYFKDGKPLIIGYDGFIRGDEPVEQHTEQPRKVIYPVLE